jgi:hypothetical protein
VIRIFRIKELAGLADDGQEDRNFLEGLAGWEKRTSAIANKNEKACRAE